MYIILLNCKHALISSSISECNKTVTAIVVRTVISNDIVNIE